MVDSCALHKPIKTPLNQTFNLLTYQPINALPVDGLLSIVLSPPAECIDPRVPGLDPPIEECIEPLVPGLELEPP